MEYIDSGTLRDFIDGQRAAGKNTSAKELRALEDPDAGERQRDNRKRREQHDTKAIRRDRRSSDYRATKFLFKASGTGPR